MFPISLFSFGSPCKYKVNTLQNWLTEFNLWLPPQEALPPDTDPAFVTGRAFKVHILNDEHK